MNAHANTFTSFHSPNVHQDGGYPQDEPPPAYTPSRSLSGRTDNSLVEKPPLDDQIYFERTESTPEYTSISENRPFLPPAVPSEPGFAAESLFTRGLQVPSKSSHVTSGFPYPSILCHYNISESDWTRFTREITQEASLSNRQWTAALGMGLGTLAIGGMMFGIFGAIPAVMVSRKARQHREEQNLAAAVAPGSASVLARRIEVWNQLFFRPRGIMIRVDLPYEALEDMDQMDVSTSNSRSSGLFSWKADQDDETARVKASHKGRIVIIPLEGRDLSGMTLPSTFSLGQQPKES